MNRFKTWAPIVFGKVVYLAYGLLILGCFFADLGFPGDAPKTKGEFDINFWLALASATGVPAFAWWMVRSGMASINKSLANTITVELCRANQAECQKALFASLSRQFAPREIETRFEDFREKREVTNARIYDEIKLNREAAIKEMSGLKDKLIEMTQQMHESLKKDVTDAILIHSKSEASKR